ncbi:MAG: hypothetical protein AAGA77_12665 [Bacteroidota bacterium]
MISKKILSVAVIAFCISVLYFFMFTPYGVHTFGETLFGGDKKKQFESSNHPSKLNGIKSISKSVHLPKKVKQPSGIDFNQEKNSFFIVTDQAEIVELSEDLVEVNSFVTMSKKPLIFRQGTVESVDFYQNKLFVGGDLGIIEIWEKQSHEWIKTGAIQSKQKNAAYMEAEALAINPSTENLYLGKDHTIAIVDQEGNLVSEFDLQVSTKDNRSVSEYAISGMDFYDGQLYVLTEYHSAILSVNPFNGEVDSIFALEGITEGAGLCVRENSFIVVVDHELNEVSPGVKFYNR